MSNDLAKWLFCELAYLLQRLELDRIKQMSESMLEQISHEIVRFHFLLNLFNWIFGMLRVAKDVTSTDFWMLTEIFRLVNISLEFRDAHKERVDALLKQLLDKYPLSGLGIAEAEFIQIKKAIGSHVTNWYKCKNGHFYGIGDCGRAQVTSKCPECKEQIGGTNHHLMPGNQLANELNAGMDIPIHIRDPFNVHYQQ